MKHAQIVQLVKSILKETKRDGAVEMLTSENGVSFKFRNADDQIVIFPIPVVASEPVNYIRLLEEQKNYEGAILPLNQFPPAWFKIMLTWTASKADQKNFISKFDAFYYNNIDQVRERTRKAPSHPLNANRVEQWAKTMKLGIETLLSGYNSRQSMMSFVDNFTKSIKRVSMNDFRNKVDEIAEEFVLYLKENSKAHDCVVLALDSYSDKSSLWVTLLAYERIKNLITHVLSVDETRKFNQRGHYKRPLIIMFDDASYSGNQYGDHVQNMCQQTTQKIIFWCAIPYVSREAKQFINSEASPNAMCIFPQSAEYFEPVIEKDALPIDYGPDLELLTKYFGVSDMKDSVPSRHALYFDHKLADKLSCYTQIMAFSVALSTNRSDPFVVLPYMIEDATTSATK